MWSSGGCTWPPSLHLFLIRSICYSSHVDSALELGFILLGHICWEACSITPIVCRPYPVLAVKLRWRREELWIVLWRIRVIAAYWQGLVLWTLREWLWSVEFSGHSMHRKREKIVALNFCTCWNHALKAKWGFVALNAAIAVRIHALPSWTRLLEYSIVSLELCVQLWPWRWHSQHRDCTFLLPVCWYSPLFPHVIFQGWKETWVYYISVIIGGSCTALWNFCCLLLYNFTVNCNLYRVSNNLAYFPWELASSSSQSFRNFLFWHS